MQFDLRFGLQSTLILHHKRSFSPHVLQRAFRLRVDEYFLKTDIFENDGVTMITWSFERPNFPETQNQTYR